jgi:hypothetical protein
MPPAVVRDVDHRVAGRHATREQLRHTGDRHGAAIHNTVQINEKQHGRMVDAASSAR